MKKFFVITVLASMLLSGCAGQHQTDIYTDANDSTDTEAISASDNGETKDNDKLAITPVGPKVEFAENKTAIKGVTIEQIGNITPQKELLFSKGDLVYAYGDFICTLDENDVFTMCDAQGNEIENCTFVGTEEPYKGYVIARQEGEMIPKSQLMTVSGDIIIPFSEVSINFLNERFLEIIVPESITENPAEAVLRLTASQLSFTVQEGDVLFKGYKRVFDLENGKYVDNIELCSNDSDIYACGDTLYVKDDHEYNMILDANGNIIAEGFKYCETVGGMYEITFDFETYALYDSNLNKTFEYDHTFGIYEIENAEALFTYFDDEFRRGVIDANGNVLFEPKFEGISSYNDGLFIVTIPNENEEYGYLYGLCDLSGDLVVPCEYEMLVYENGFYKATKQNDAGYAILDSVGNIVVESSEYLDYYSYKESKGLFYVLALNSGEYQMEFERSPEKHIHAFGLLSAYDKISGGYALFEYIDGTQLTEYKYEDFKYHNGCIYALNNGVYTIYQINYQH